MQKRHCVVEESEGREVEERARWRGQERKVTSSGEAASHGRMRAL